MDVRRGEEEEGENIDPEGAKGPWLESERRGREGGEHGRRRTEELLRRKREQRRHSMEANKSNFQETIKAKSGALKQLVWRT